MYDHLADPRPPTDTTQVRRQVGRRLARRRRAQRAGGAGVALCAIAAVAIGVGLTRSSDRSNVIVGGVPAGPLAAGSSFLTVTSISPATRHNLNPGLELQDRSLATGRVQATLVKGTSVRAISASIGPDGTVIAAVTTGQCGAVLESINPHTGKATAIGDVADASGGVTGLSVSPDGRHIAYEAYPGCQQGTPTPTTTAPAHPTAPSTTSTQDTYLAVRDLATGATVETSFDFQGVVFDGNGGPVWSPDGTQLAVLAPPHNNRIMLVSAAHPDFQAATTLRLPARCEAVGDINAIGAWNRSGLTVSLSCAATGTARTSPGRAQSYLEQVTSTGRVIYRTPMTNCLAVNSMESVPGAPAIVGSYNAFPFGSTLGARCKAPQTLVASYDQGRLRTVLSLPRALVDLPA